MPGPTCPTTPRMPKQQPYSTHRTPTRRLRAFAKDSWRRQISAACAAHAGLGPASLVLYDVSTLYFDTDEGDGLREPGYSKERRLDPQITIGLLTDWGANGRNRGITSNTKSSRRHSKYISTVVYKNCN